MEDSNHESKRGKGGKTVRELGSCFLEQVWKLLVGWWIMSRHPLAEMLVVVLVLVLVLVLVFCFFLPVPDAVLRGSKFVRESQWL